MPEQTIPPNAPRVAFKTIGCRLNQAETMQMAEQFRRAGYRVSDATKGCDIAVINTCTITHNAERDCARWGRRLRREGVGIVVLAGCAVEHNGSVLRQRAEADLIATQQQKMRLPEIIAEKFGIHPTPPNLPESFHPPRSRTRALVKAQDGCNFRCSYCIVPDTRGKPYSLPMQKVLDDIKHFSDLGYKEVVITGANIGCYRDRDNTLVTLLEKAETISGIERIRISSIESTTTERDVIDFMASSAKLCRFLHIPLQSGDDEILKRMRRHYTAAQYRALAEYAAAKVPDIGLGTDIIVGFPGESDTAFRNTRQLVKDLPFSNLHIFSYSKRSGTPAATMPDQVNEDAKKERSTTLIELGKAKRHQFAEKFINRQVDVLIENIGDDGTASGWTGEYLRAELPAENLHENTIISFTPSAVRDDILLGF